MPFTFDTLFTKLSGIVPVKFVAKLFCISNVLAVSLLEFCLAIDVAFLIEIPKHLIDIKEKNSYRYNSNNYIEIDEDAFDY